jgi:hypothetical protein
MTPNRYFQEYCDITSTAWLIADLPPLADAADSDHAGLTQIVVANKVIVKRLRAFAEFELPRRHAHFTSRYCEALAATGRSTLALDICDELLSRYPDSPELTALVRKLAKPALYKAPEQPLRNADE